MDSQTLNTIKAQVARHVGRTLRQVREERGWSRILLSSILGNIGDRYIEDIENGRDISAGEIYMLATALGIPMARLFPAAQDMSVMELYHTISDANQRREEALKELGHATLTTLEWVDAEAAQKYGIPVVYDGEQGVVVLVNHEYRVRTLSGAVKLIPTKDFALQVYRELTAGMIGDEPFLYDGESWLVVKHGEDGVQIKPANGQGKWKWIPYDTPVQRFTAEVAE